MKDPVVAENLQRSGIPDVFHRDPFPKTGHAADHLLKTVGLPEPELPDLWNADAGRVLLHPGSGSPAKVWPHFVEFARAFPEAAILKGPGDEALNVPNACLKDLSLTDVAEEVRRCRVFIGNDSGITHLAAYWGTPTIALFGPTDPGIWGPRGRRVKLLKRNSLADITIDDVRMAL